MAASLGRGTMWCFTPSVVLVGFSLLWLQGGAAPTTSLSSTEDIPSTTTETVTAGIELRHCTSDEDCHQGNPQLICDRERSTCTCKASEMVLSQHAPDKCLLAKQLGEGCDEDVQCRFLDQHALCAEAYCACDSGFYQLHEENGTLCRPGSTETAVVAGTQLDMNMIAVIIALAVMFFGICVALHLFSRARFRNRRTIFNSPHPRLMHIKLGKKKKKKLSGSQHLTTPVHQPVVPRHHSFSGNHVPSPLPLNRIPKTRSHECLRSAARRDSSPRLEMRYTPRAPLAERESSSVPSTEDLDKKTPDPVLPNGVALIGEQDQECPPGSPTVIITDADGSHHQVVSSSRSSLTNGSAVNV